MNIHPTVQLTEAHDETDRVLSKALAPPPYLRSPRTKHWRVDLDLLNAASLARREPLRALGTAAFLHAISRDDPERNDALARADLLVTGRATREGYYAAWARAAHPAKDSLALFEGRAPTDALASSLDVVLARLADIERHLSFGRGAEHATEPHARRAFKPTRGSRWIAVAAERDAPWAPVNVAASAWSQRTLEIDCGLPKKVASRYVLAGDPEAGDGPLIVHLHGLGSRAEEVDALAEHLVPLGYVLAAPDLPGNGYTDQGALAGALDVNDWIEDPAHPTTQFPFLDLVTKFAIAFIAALRKEHPGLAARPLCVIGGSLGGNLTLRLTLDETAKLGQSLSLKDVSWRPDAIALWSPASLWDPLFPGPLKDIGPKTCFAEATRDEGAERVDDPPARRDYFWRTFEQTVNLGEITIVRPTVEQWYWSGFALVDAYREASRFDRYERYDEAFRRWQWRLAYEQLVFSYRTAGRADRIAGSNGAVPVLLMVGMEDEFHWTNIRSNMQWLATTLAARKVPGDAFVFARTGHSFHDERPRLLSRKLNDFLQTYVVP